MIACPGTVGARRAIWYPDCSLVTGYVYSIVSLVPSNDESDIAIIKQMSSLPTEVAEEWIDCVRNSRIANAEPEGVKEQMLTERVKQIIDAQRIPTESEWDKIKTIAGAVVGFWASGYASERAEKFGKDLRVAQAVLRLRDSMLGEDAEHPFDGALWKWNWLKNEIQTANHEPWRDQYR